MGTKCCRPRRTRSPSFFWSFSADRPFFRPGSLAFIVFKLRCFPFSAVRSLGCASHCRHYYFFHASQVCFVSSFFLLDDVMVILASIPHLRALHTLQTQTTTDKDQRQKVLLSPEASYLFSLVLHDLEERGQLRCPASSSLCFRECRAQHFLVFISRESVVFGDRLSLLLRIDEALACRAIHIEVWVS